MGVILLKSQIIFGLSAIFSFVLSSAAHSQPTVNAKNGYKDMVAIVTDGSGAWTQQNEDFSIGGDAPKYWLQIARRGPGDLSIVRDAYAVSEDGVCTLLNHSVSGWKAENQVAKAFGVSPGILMEGEFSFPESNKAQLDMVISMPDGTSFEMRDLTDFATIGVQSVQAWRKQNGEWALANAVEWVKSDQGNPCSID